MFNESIYHKREASQLRSHCHLHYDLCKNISLDLRAVYLPCAMYYQAIYVIGLPVRRHSRDAMLRLAPDHQLTKGKHRISYFMKNPKQNYEKIQN